VGGWYACRVEVAASCAVYFVGRPRGFRRLQSLATSLIAASALIAGLLLVETAQSRIDANPSLVVTFTTAGTISVTQPDGTPVGSASSAATVIPAGYYTLMLYGPGGCAYLPVFELKGPGESIIDDMRGGEWETFQYNAYFLPNSTYTWRNDANPAVVYTFKTSASVVGTPPGQALPGTSSGKGSTVSSQDPAGSAVLPFRGTLTGAVSASGTLTLAYKGKSVSSLKAGRYTIDVNDKSSTTGFMLQKVNHAVMSITGMTFVGKRSATVRLTAGKWLVIPRLGTTTYSIVVS
jgi:hypothetical protein